MAEAIKEGDARLEGDGHTIRLDPPKCYDPTWNALVQEDVDAIARSPGSNRSNDLSRHGDACAVHRGMFSAALTKAAAIRQAEEGVTD